MGLQTPRKERLVDFFDVRQDISPGALEKDHQIFFGVSAFITYFTSMKITNATITKSIIAPI